MRLTAQIALLTAWGFLNLQALSRERAGWAGRDLLLSDKMHLLSVKIAIGDRLMAFVRSATDKTVYKCSVVQKLSCYLIVGFPE